MNQLEAAAVVVEDPELDELEVLCDPLLDVLEPDSLAPDFSDPDFSDPDFSDDPDESDELDLVDEFLPDSRLSVR